MYTLEIKDITKQTSVETGERFLAVNFEILDKKDVIFTKSVGFPMGTDIEDIKAELAKHLDNYKLEVEKREAQAIIDKEDKNADNIIEELQNQKL